MIFSSMAASRFRRAAAGLAALVALGFVVACGGGTSQSEPFVAQRYFAFGDEASALTATGRNYAVNGLATDGTVGCNVLPIWTQQMAGFYGFVLAECNPTAVTDIKARSFAAVGARVAEVAAQVDAQVAAGGFRDKDIATVMVGVNDIVELYGQYPARSEAALLADARARGERAASIVNRLVDLGSKVVVSTIPDMGLSPWARAQKALFTDTDRAALISRLSTAYNEQLGVKLRLDGRFIGLVQLDLQVQVINRAPGAFGFANVTDAACATALPDCTTATLVTGGDANLYLWADGTRLSAGGQAQLGSLATSRANRNPF
jgi:phospholipase/lecithinase/hemolysin